MASECFRARPGGMPNNRDPHASGELYGLLKRPDEKHATERAYDNPKFVENRLRDIAVELNRDKRITW